MKKTKIVCTIGPSCDDPEILEQLIKEGMDVARLNFSHGTHKAHARTIQTIRERSKKLEKPVAIMQDLCGPKIRVASFTREPVELKPGDSFILWDTINRQGDNRGVGCSYPNLSKEVGTGERILLADGTIELFVKKRADDHLICEVLTGGLLSSRKGMNLPGTSLNVSAVTEKDLDDLAFGIEMGVDFVALSFVRKPEDINPLKRTFKEKGKHIPIIAKIEKHEALNCLDNILNAVNGIMVARGDLGVEIPLEQVPLVQKQIIKKANRAGKPVITATQMLRSMVESPRPTRAEAADVANAIMDGTDAIMLSEETASGAYPVEAAKFMHRIAKSTEKSLDYEAILREKNTYKQKTVSDSVSHAACNIAQNVDAKLIIAATQSGYTARMISRFRPKSPIIALTSEHSTQMELALSWGIFPFLIDKVSDLDTMFAVAKDFIKKFGLAQTWERAILTAGVPLGEAGKTNLIRVITVT